MIYDCLKRRQMSGLGSVATTRTISTEYTALKAPPHLKLFQEVDQARFHGQIPTETYGYSVDTASISHHLP